MIAVDTSVWIDFLRSREEPLEVALLVRLLKNNDVRIVLTDVVFSEILQGLRDDAEAERVEDYLLDFLVLRLEGLDDFRRAAALHRAARKQGFTIRRTSDCLIASVCIRENVPLLHRDADFARLAEATDLRVVEVPTRD